MLALEKQFAVDHVLKHLRTRNSALLVDMTDNKDGHAAALGQLHEGHCAVLDL